MDNPYSRFWKLAACVPLASAAVSSCAQAAVFQGTGTVEQATQRWTFHHEQVLGTSLEISVRSASVAEARRAEAAVLGVFDHDDALLSTWRSDSEVSRWAGTRFEPVAVSAELFEVLAGFDRWRERTGGALDASVEAATRLWHSATAEGRVPSADEIAVAVEAMQQPHWTLDRKHRTATRLSEVPLALASFAKSYISARAADAALKEGASGVMLNVGGDVVVRGNMTQLVAVADPQASAENDVPVAYVVVRDQTMATSGLYRRGFEVAQGEGFNHYSHLIDPRTAMPAGHVLSSTVIARDAMTAGALATAMSVLAVDESRRLAASVPGVEYLLVLAGGEEVRSANWPEAAGFRAAGSRAAGFERAAAVKAAGAAAAPAGLWDADFELSVNLTLPRIEEGRYHRPYVAVWIEDADHFPVRTLALWTQNPRWLPELKQWYHDDQARHLTEGTDLSRTISSATRPPGEYTLKWDGKDNAGKPVKAGRYTVCLEAAREHGGYDVQRQEWTFDARAQQLSLPAAKELGAVTFDYHKR